MDVTILTATYGADTPQEQAEQDWDANVSWVCVTDDASCRDMLHWDAVEEPRPHVSPRMAAKVPKYFPGLYSDDELIIWVDGAVKIHSPLFVQEVYESLQTYGGCMALIPHPDRSSIREEAPEAAAQLRYRGQMIADQVSHYETLVTEGEDNKLWASTVIGWHNCEYATTFGALWMLENIRWSAQDQLSLAMLLKVHMVDPAVLKMNLWDNDFFTLRERDETIN